MFVVGDIIQTILDAFFLGHPVINSTKVKVEAELGNKAVHLRIVYEMDMEFEEYYDIDLYFFRNGSVFYL